MLAARAPLRMTDRTVAPSVQTEVPRLASNLRFCLIRDIGRTAIASKTVAASEVELRGRNIRI